jgi:single-strand DNA-binding protein
MINRVILVGRMANDTELRYTPSGIAVAQFRLAVERPFKSAEGQKETDFIDIVAWRQPAQFAADYLRKGRMAGVEGRLQVRAYTTREGQRRKAVEVVADSVRALDKGKDESQEETGDQQYGDDAFEGQ